MKKLCAFVLAAIMMLTGCTSTKDPVNEEPAPVKEYTINTCHASVPMNFNAIDIFESVYEDEDTRPTLVALLATKEDSGLNYAYLMLNDDYQIAHITVDDSDKATLTEVSSFNFELYTGKNDTKEIEEDENGWIIYEGNNSELEEDVQLKFDAANEKATYGCNPICLLGSTETKYAFLTTYAEDMDSPVKLSIVTLEDNSFKSICDLDPNDIIK